MAGLTGLKKNPKRPQKKSRRKPLSPKRPPSSSKRRDLPQKTFAVRKQQSLVITLFFLLIFVGSFLLYRYSLNKEITLNGIRLGGISLPAIPYHNLSTEFDAIKKKLATRKIVFILGKHRFASTLGMLGFSFNRKTTMMQLKAVGKSGHVFDDLFDRIAVLRGKYKFPLSINLNNQKAISYFERMKRFIDRPIKEAQIDIKSRKIVSGRPGLKLDIYNALAATEASLRDEKWIVKLPLEVISPKRKFNKDLDISYILGQFTTVYSLATTAKNRTHNLKVGAAKLDGYILKPGETLSYNDVVGPRTKAQGYRTAHVISQGELVDGMAGGSCQLSSTLFAASFFAGLDLESSRPHTIPSSYIKMGLDATVAYGTTDLVIKNPYPFSVLISFKVSRGKVEVTLLGKKRPYQRIDFKRIIKKVEPFKEVERKVDHLPKGIRLVKQRGVPGFTIERHRLFYKGNQKEPVKHEKRTLRYPPTTQFVEIGTGPPNPDFKEPKEKQPFGDVKEEFIMSR